MILPLDATSSWGISLLRSTGPGAMAADEQEVELHSGEQVSCVSLAQLPSLKKCTGCHEGWTDTQQTHMTLLLGRCLL